MNWLADGGQMREIDRIAIEDFGVPGQLLMEAASAFAAGVAATFFRPQGKVIVVAGSGNNGGDGWGVARHLAARNFAVQVVSAVDPGSLQGDARNQFQIYESYGLPWQLFSGGSQFEDCALIVDALLGTGVRGAPRGVAAEIITAINAKPAPVMAIDIPSGLPAGCEPPGGEVIQAAATTSFGLAKVGLYTPAGRQAAGKIFVDPIGLPAQLLRNTCLVLNDAANAAQGLPVRSLDSHKGKYGHGLLVAGSRGMRGAAILAGNSALKSGIGLLTVACPSQVEPVIQGSLWEALSLPLASTGDGTFAPEAKNQVDLGKYSAAAIGPGCGVCPGTGALVQLLLEASLPLILDADALNGLAPGIPSREFPTIISPHPGEMARLLGNNIEDVVANPLENCQRAVQNWGCTVILKGSSTYIASPDGRRAVNVTGTDGLATGGSGDVLTGLLLGLLAQGVEPFAAACAGTWLLGTASELAAAKVGTASQLPRDVLDCLPRAYLKLTDFST